MLRRYSRGEEARDLARFAIGQPLWTLGGDDLVELCGLAKSSQTELASQLRDKADGKLSEEDLKMQNGMEKRSPQQIAKDRASYLLDLVVAAPDEYSWQSVREELATRYREADMNSIAAFVSAPAA